jgi:hypothetical protein
VPRCPRPAPNTRETQNEAGERLSRMCLAQGFRVKISVHDVYVSEKINSGYQMILGAFVFRLAIWSKIVDAVSKQSPREDGKHAGHLHRALGQGLWRCGAVAVLWPTLSVLAHLNHHLFSSCCIAHYCTHAFSTCSSMLSNMEALELRS